jgi:hypothetical protein
VTGLPKARIEGYGETLGVKCPLGAPSHHLYGGRLAHWLIHPLEIFLLLLFVIFVVSARNWWSSRTPPNQ